MRFLLDLLRSWKSLTWHKFLYFPRLLTSKEQKIFLLLLCVVVGSGGFLFTRIYVNLTRPVPALGGSYTEGVIGAPHFINPLYASQDADRDLTRLICGSLLTYSGTGVLIPDMAEKYDVSADGKTYTVTLRKNMVWHDGTPITADDVLFTIKTIQNPLYKSVLRANWQGVSVDKIDDTTIRLTLRNAYSPFIENLTAGILPKHIWQNISPEQILLNQKNLEPVGSGPYQFSSFKQAKDGTILSYTLKANTHYYRNGPYINWLTLMFFPDEAKTLHALQQGTIDGYSPVSLNKTSESSVPYTTLDSIQISRIFNIFFNQKTTGALSDIRVRQAIAYAMDKNKIVAQTVSGGGVLRDSVFPPTFSSTTPATVYALNINKAQALLDQAGWKDSNNDGVREKRTLDKKKKTTVTPLRITLSTSDSPDLVHAAQLIKDMLAQIGIDTVIDTRPFADLEADVIKKRNFDMLLFGQVYGYEPDPFAFWHSSQIKDPGLNVSLYTSKKADKLLEDARKTSDLTIQQNKYNAVAELIAEDLPAIPLYSQLYLYLLPSKIQGIHVQEIALPSDRFNEVNEWYIKTKRVLK